MDTKTQRYDSEIEKQMVDLFQKQGWDCKLTSEPIRVAEGNSFIPDITLENDGRVFGYVECYGDVIAEKKQEQILYILDTCKPELFILTNGANYEVYFDSKYVGSMTVPIGYNEFTQKNGYLCTQK